MPKNVADGEVLAEDAAAALGKVLFVVPDGVAEDVVGAIGGVVGADATGADGGVVEGNADGAEESVPFEPPASEVPLNTAGKGKPALLHSDEKSVKAVRTHTRIDDGNVIVSGALAGDACASLGSNVRGACVLEVRIGDILEHPIMSEDIDHHCILRTDMEAWSRPQSEAHCGRMRPSGMVKLSLAISMAERATGRLEAGAAPAVEPRLWGDKSVHCEAYPTKSSTAQKERSKKWC
ncbi:hypothetical protein B0H11DRAFT_1928100 [Mycena galericulata]|nr:hypothetical protein B0H11DRAFT_1928100 [Mycena galericulata]